MGIVVGASELLAGEMRIVAPADGIMTPGRSWLVRAVADANLADRDAKHRR